MIGLKQCVKQAIIRLKNQNKPLTEIATTSVAKSNVWYIWYILKKKESIGDFRNTKRPGRLWKTTVVNGRRILSLVKKTKPFTISGQIKNTLQYIGVSVSKSTIMRRIFTTQCRPLVSLKNRKTILEPRKSKTVCQFWNNILWTDETTCIRMMKRIWKRKGTVDPKQHVHVWLPMELDPFVFIDAVTADKSSRMNYEVYRAILSALIQPNALKRIGWYFTLQMDNDPKHISLY